MFVCFRGWKSGWGGAFFLWPSLWFIQKGIADDKKMEAGTLVGADLTSKNSFLLTQFLSDLLLSFSCERVPWKIRLGRIVFVIAFNRKKALPDILFFCFAQIEIYPMLLGGHRFPGSTGKQKTDPFQIMCKGVVAVNLMHRSCVICSRHLFYLQ